ncbi:MAG: 16S rRNA (cytidine(1402)-2'-O)-methyltransferase [Trueperaceae bacterium]|nr:16S rRNA (cytidine(1402)-2'-O)-methyltransferase [Trueperaceae bacterium]
MSRLILVPTPIGALHDITLHALEVLRTADVVAAEDTRRSGNLLAHHGIATPLVRLDAHTVASRGPGVLSDHDVVAYVSDAGTPGVSDPGADLVRLALAAGHEVEALPGPTAFVPALVLSGLPLARFSFDGFLPRKGAARGRRIGAIARRDHPTAIYEAPPRVAATLADLAEACGDERPASVSRELTKKHEETARGSLAELAARFTRTAPRGECVVIVGGRAEDEAPESDTPEGEALAVALASAGVTGRTLRDALQALGVPRNDAYRLALDVREGDAGR